MNTGKKVTFKNGRQRIVRAVYADEDGRHYFKYKNEQYYIYQREDGRYHANWFPVVEYVEEEE